MIKVAVIGVGSIGVHHARIVSGLPDAVLTGVVDTDFSRAQHIASKYNCTPFRHHSEIMGMVDAVVISAPTSLHHQIAIDCLKNGKDILIEKPMTSTLKEAEELILTAAKKNLIIQVGHLERFNAGLLLMSSMITAPLLIESRRLSPFLGRSTDVHVTLDLMIHDIDIILSLVKSGISDLRATGSRVLSDNIDIAYAWIEFNNGCIAEVVASRIANEKVREIKVFQHDNYLNLNYLTQEILNYKKINDKVEKEFKKAEEKEPLREQLKSFIDCVKNRAQPVVSVTEGRNALEVTLQITEMIKNGNTAKSK